MFIISKTGNKLLRFLNFDFEEKDTKNSQVTVSEEIQKIQNIESGKDIKILTDVKTIGKYSFKDIDTVESVIIGKNVDTIEEFAFENCSKLVAIKIGKDEKDNKISKLTISSNAFKNCCDLTEVIICANDKINIVIEKDAFNCCYSLKTLYFNIENNKKGINLRTDAFENCNLDKLVIIANDVVEKYCLANGIKFIHC